MAKKKYSTESAEEINLSILAELVADSRTSDHLRVQIINQLMETQQGQSFFKTMFEEDLSLGTCPDCDHVNHWLIPEDNLNEFGWVSYKRDSRVKEHTTQVDCPQYGESCLKKKVTV